MTDVLRAHAAACHGAAVRAVDPARLVAGHLRRHRGTLLLGASDGAPVARHAGPVVLVGAGKAALAMGRAAAAAAWAALAGGIVIVPHGGEDRGPDGIELRSGAHPVPDGAGVAATARLLEVVARASRDALVVVVLSGGGSALCVAPPLGVTLADKQAVTERLLAAGADVAELNTVRKHCSRVKGGGLARAAAGRAGLWTLLLSDVIGDDPATIASGPTVADRTTFADAARVLADRLPPDAVPAAIRSYVARGVAGHVTETVKPGDPVLDATYTRLIGGNREAVAAAAQAAHARGYHALVLDEPLVGDAAAAGRLVAQRLLGAPRDRPVAIVGGGETTVRVVPGGHGGRCQHLALGAAIALAGEPGVVLAAGTDGVDGPTDAAGACVDGGTVARARAHGLDAAWALAATDSHVVLAASGDLVRTGPTGTNVADVVVALRGAC